MNRDTNEMKEWLYDLTNGRITDDAIVKGFLKHYALHGLTIAHVQQDIRFRTCYSDEDCRRAMETLEEALTVHANAPEPPESRTLDEVREIVAAVRAGIPMQVAYADPDEDENPYVVKPCW